MPEMPKNVRLRTLKVGDFHYKWKQIYFVLALGEGPRGGKYALIAVAEYSSMGEWVSVTNCGTVIGSWLPMSSCVDIKEVTSWRKK